MVDYKGCCEESNEVIILTDIVQKVITINRSDAWNIDSYLNYSVGYDKKIKSYTKYIIKQRTLDNYNNLILVCEAEYTKIE